MKALRSRTARLAVLMALTSGAPSLALAQEAGGPPATRNPPAGTSTNPSGENPNFSMQPVEGGLMKLDTRTGAMSFCSRKSGACAGGWVCEAVPEDRAALEAEIGRLQTRIAELEKGRGVTPGVPDIMSPPSDEARPGAPPQTTPPAKGEGELTEEARRQLDEAMKMAENVFRRFIDMIDRLRHERETPPADEKL